MATHYPSAVPQAQEGQLAFRFLDHERSPVLREFLAIDEPLARNRRWQAWRAMPFLGDEIVKFRNQIDQGAPLLEAIAQRYGVSVRAVRRLRELPEQELAECGIPLEHVAEALDAAGAHRPKRGQLKLFLQGVDIVRLIAVDTGLPEAELFRRTKLIEAVPVHDAAVGEFTHAGDPLERAWRVVLLPELLHQAKLAGFRLRTAYLDELLREPPESIVPVLARAFYGRKGPAAILDTVVRWRAGAGYPLSTPGGEHALRILLRLPSWDSPVPQPYPSGDLEVAALTDVRSLVAEGLSLRHCVGRMAIRCAYGEDHIVSVRTRNGFRVATALLRVGPAGKFEVVEHRGFGNGTVDPRAQKALEGYTERLKELTSADLQRLEAGRRARLQAAGGEDEATCQLYPIYSAVLREWYFRAYVAPCLPQPFRSGELSLWLTAYGLREVATRLLPRVGET